MANSESQCATYEALPLVMDCKLARVDREQYSASFSVVCVAVYYTTNTIYPSPRLLITRMRKG